MSDEEEKARPHPKPASDANYYATFTREEWIAYLADRVTPAYAGWADNFSAGATRTDRREEKDGVDATKN